MYSYQRGLYGWSPGETKVVSSLMRFMCCSPSPRIHLDGFSCSFSFSSDEMLHVSVTSGKKERRKVGKYRMSERQKLRRGGKTSISISFKSLFLIEFWKEEIPPQTLLSYYSVTEKVLSLFSIRSVSFFIHPNLEEYVSTRLSVSLYPLYLIIRCIIIFTEIRRKIVLLLQKRQDQDETRFEGYFFCLPSWREYWREKRQSSKENDERWT